MMVNFKAKSRGAAALFVLLAFISAACGAEVYKWQGENGETHYSDRTVEGAQTVAVAPGYTYLEVKKVYDGDTVLLQNGRKVRLLGINTPEIAHRDKDAEAGGDTAKAWLEQRLRSNQVRLQGDVEKSDKYGRELAYLFCADGANINVELVSKGLAAVTIHPPNLLYVEALLAAQRSAEDAKLGIWNLPDYAVKPVEVIDSSSNRGWQRVSGRVNKVRSNGKFVYLDLSPQFSARIAPDDLALFGDPKEYLGKAVEVRGWLSRSKQHYTLPLRHPSAIRILK